MTPEVHFNLGGLFEPGRLDAWSHAQRATVRRGVAGGMRDEAPRIAGALNDRVRRSFKTTNRGFTQQFKAKLYDRKPDRLPMLLVRSKIPWMGLYARGGVIDGPLLIPLNQAKRIRTDVFRKIVRELIARGNAFFKKVNGKVILFAENIAENRPETRRFTKGLRKGLGGGRFKRSAEIPIAILVPRVEVKKRLDLPAAVRPRLAGLVRAIERHIVGA